MDFSRFLPWDAGELAVTNNILIKSLKLYGEILSGKLIRYYDYYVGKSITKNELTFTNSHSYNSNYVISDAAILPGEWYWENKIVVSGLIKIGVANSNYPNANSTWFYCSDGTIVNKDVTIVAPTYTTNDIISIRLDTQKGFIYFLKNNSLVSELPSFNNLYGSELYSCMELGTGSSIEVVFNPLTYVTLYNEGLYDYVTNVEQGLEELQFFWDVYKSKVVNKYKNILDPDNIVRRIQDIKNSNNQPVGSPSEQAYFLNLPELLKSKGTIKSLKGIFNFFGIGIEVVPWYSSEYHRPQKTGVIIRIVLGGEYVSDSEIYTLIEQLVYLVLDVCAVVTYINVYKKLETDGFDLSELLGNFELEVDKCLPYVWPDARKDLKELPIVNAPFKGYFSGRDACNTDENLPDYSGKYSSYCPSMNDCVNQKDRRLYVALKDTTFQVGENKDIIEYSFIPTGNGISVVPVYGSSYTLLVGESRASVPIKDPNNYPSSIPQEVINKYSLPIVVGSQEFTYCFNSTISNGGNSISGYNTFEDFYETCVVKETLITREVIEDETAVYETLTELIVEYDWYNESFDYDYAISEERELFPIEFISETVMSETQESIQYFDKDEILTYDFNSDIYLDGNTDGDLDFSEAFINEEPITTLINPIVTNYIDRTLLPFVGTMVIGGFTVTSEVPANETITATSNPIISEFYGNIDYSTFPVIGAITIGAFTVAAEHPWSDSVTMTILED